MFTKNSVLKKYFFISITTTGLVIFITLNFAGCRKTSRVPRLAVPGAVGSSITILPSFPLEQTPPIPILLPICYPASPLLP